jgi:hypothetical protein
MSQHIRTLGLAIALLLWSQFASEASAAPPADPLFRTVDLNIGETATLKLADDRSTTVRLIAVDEQVDSVRDAVRSAKLKLEFDGRPFDLTTGPYRLPMPLAGSWKEGRYSTGVQVDCPVTKGMNRNGSPEFWGLDKDARIRVWSEGQPWIMRGTFRNPVKQKWFATHTQMANEPTYVDGGERPDVRKIYYHSGLDIGGSEGDVEVVAATDGLIVSVGTNVLPEHKSDTPVAPRYDVVYLLDARGWYYRYSHFKEIDKEILPGRTVKIGQRLGLLGKEGASGGWSHLHFEIKSRQPSGKWGTEEGYPFLWQSYREAEQPRLMAVARPHHLIKPGESVELDAGRSWSAAEGKIASYKWTFTDGSTGSGERVTRTYPKPGIYSEVLEIQDAAGHIDRDFAVVNVVDPTKPELLPPTIHPAYSPTTGLRPNQEITFKVRTFRTTDGEETWNFGDGTPPVKTKSDGAVKALAPDGYAVTTHRYTKPGRYVVRVERTSAAGITAVAHLHVAIEATETANTDPTTVPDSVKLKPTDLDEYFSPPKELAGDFGTFRSPLKFADGREVRTPDEWQARRKEILANWHGVLGAWPPLVEKPKLKYNGSLRLEHHTRHAVDIESMPDGRMQHGYLLVPHGEGPFPAAVVVFYEPETSVGIGKEMHAFGYHLANRGYVVLAIGTPSGGYWPNEKTATLQPLSMHAYAAANCHTALAHLPNVDAARIGVLGHSYGGKWAMFASCLYDKFACAAWSDGGIVFDEKRGNVNYWEPWYLGHDLNVKRKPGMVTAANPRTGAYKTMIEQGFDLHELHALMAPRPLLVSAGSEDPPARWQALNHSIAVNKLLGIENRVAMTNRRNHTPTPESNEAIYAFFDRFLKSATKP